MSYVFDLVKYKTGIQDEVNDLQKLLHSNRVTPHAVNCSSLNST
jgi:hypothetical protein